MTVELSNLAALAMLGFMLFAGALMLFMVFVQPIWCLVDCAVDRRRSGGAKAVWIIVLVIFYGVASWFYGALAAAGPWLRRVTRLAWLMLALLVVGFIAMYSTSSEFRRNMDEQMTRGRGLVVQAPADHALRAAT